MLYIQFDELFYVRYLGVILGFGFLVEVMSYAWKEYTIVFCCQKQSKIWTPNHCSIVCIQRNFSHTRFSGNLMVLNKYMFILSKKRINTCSYFISSTIFQHKSRFSIFSYYSDFTSSYINVPFFSVFCWLVNNSNQTTTANKFFINYCLKTNLICLNK